MVKELKENVIFFICCQNLSRQNEKLFEDIFQVVIMQCKPIFVLYTVKFGGRLTKIPYPSIKNKGFLVIRWLVDAIKERYEDKLQDRLVKEFSDILKRKGNVVKKADEFLGVGQFNRTFLKRRMKIKL